MAANTSPIFSKLGQIDLSVAITAANTAKDGTGTVTIVFTADATNGGLVDHIKINSLGTNVATVMRFFYNNGSTNATATNNGFIGEISLPATTLIETAMQPPQFFNIGFPLPPGGRIIAVLGTAVSAGWQCLPVGGNY